MKEFLNQAVEIIHTSRKTISLTGAGVSTESGIPDFRSKGGLWSRFDPIEYGTIGAFRRDPEKVWKMLTELMFIVDAKPNSGHVAMAQMEQAGLLHGIITQNIDMLHQKAGSRFVVEFHGSLASFSCLSCTRSYSQETVLKLKIPPICDCGEFLKPDIVFFDESIPVDALTSTEELISGAEVLLVAGTSCQVAPASSIPFMVKQHGGTIIEINREPALGQMADIPLVGNFSSVMTKLVGNLDL